MNERQELNREADLSKELRCRLQFSDAKSQVHACAEPSFLWVAGMFLLGGAFGALQSPMQVFKT